jgi:hypothetical protein
VSRRTSIPFSIFAWMIFLRKRDKRNPLVEQKNKKTKQKRLESMREKCLPLHVAVVEPAGEDDKTEGHNGGHPGPHVHVDVGHTVCLSLSEWREKREQQQEKQKRKEKKAVHKANLSLEWRD